MSIQMSIIMIVITAHLKADTKTTFSSTLKQFTKILNFHVSHVNLKATEKITYKDI